MPSSYQPETFLPLKSRVFAMLTGLAERPQHGYALMNWLEQAGDGTKRVGPTTLYRTLDELCDSGLIRATGEDPREPRRGETFELTDLGREVLKCELVRLDQVTARARSALRSPGL